MGDRAEARGRAAVPADAGGEVVAALSGVVKRLGSRTVLAGVDAAFRRGTLTLIRGERGSGRTTLARILTGQTLPTAGAVGRTGPAAPLIGSSDVFSTGGSAIEALDFRAAAHGLATGPYVAAVARLMPDPEALRAPFGRLTGLERQVLLFAASWLIPADLYVSDGALAPTAPAVRRRIEPLVAAARVRAAVVWIAEARAAARDADPDAERFLEDGRLVRRAAPS